jgi:hypothetical protein
MATLILAADAIKPQTSDGARVVIIVAATIVLTAIWWK